MSQYRKLTHERLSVDQIIVAYKPKSRTLNMANGRFVKIISKAEKSVKVLVLGTKEELRFSLNTEGTWAYDPSSADTEVFAHPTDYTAWPGFTQRMQSEGWDGKRFKFDASELHTDTREGSRGNGLTLLRHRGETIDPDTNAPYINNFLMDIIYPASAPEWRVPRAERMGVGAVELPLPPKPVSAETQSIIDKITPVFGTLKNHQRSNVSFAKFSADFKECAKHLDKACHSAIQESEDFEVAYIASYGLHDVSDGHWKKGDPVNKEAVDLFITYLTSYSPYADAFLTKDVEYIKKNGYILTADAPKRIVAGALYATRQMWERPQRLDGFYELYKAGVEINKAFVFGCQTSQYDGNTMKMSEPGNSHSHLNHRELSDECLINFIEHSPTDAGEPYKEDCYASSGGSVDYMWSKKAGDTSKMYQKLSNIKGNGSWGAALPIEDVVEQAADLIDEWSAKMGI